jgi:epoxyqueuosine reductase
MVETLARTIKEKALELGYEKCGIIKLSEYAGFSDKLKERISRIFLGRLQFGQFRKLGTPEKERPWVKSIVVAVRNYAGYNVPEEFKGVYGKSYLFDPRVDRDSEGYKSRERFGAFLENQGLRIADEPKFGLVGLRWAAHKAGLGLIRQNNFFYTENGSWNTIEGWLVDWELEVVEKSALVECPDNCHKCQDACPTGSLSRPYTMALIKCASFINSLSVEKGLGLPSLKTAAKIGPWLYGCDACQDVCPFNKGQWRGGRDFQGLGELAEYMRPERIMNMGYDELAQTLKPKFFYIGLDNPDHLWKWKISALTVMMNGFKEGYGAPIKSGLIDTDRRVRKFAKKVCAKLGI